MTPSDDGGGGGRSPKSTGTGGIAASAIVEDLHEIRAKSLDNNDICVKKTGQNYRRCNHIDGSQEGRSQIN